MKVILQQDVATLGKVGAVLNVADGYGRNFLLPRGLALLADDGNVARLEHQKRVTAHKRAKIEAEAKATAEKLNSLAITLKRQAGEEDKLFGAVTNRDIGDALATEGYNVDRRDILLADPIRTIGVFHVDIKLAAGVKAQVKVYVIRE